MSPYLWPYLRLIWSFLNLWKEALPKIIKINPEINLVQACPHLVTLMAFSKKYSKIQ
jgi:hypothetical protein